MPWVPPPQPEQVQWISSYQFLQRYSKIFLFHNLFHSPFTLCMRTDKLSTSTVVNYARINNSRTSKSRVCCYCQKWNVLIAQLELTRLFPSLLTFMHVVLFHTWNWCVTWDNFGSFLLLQLTFFPLHFPDYPPLPPLFVYALENGYVAAAPG